MTRNVKIKAVRRKINKKKIKPHTYTKAADLCCLF